MSDDADSKFVPTTGEKAFILVFAVAGYLIGWYVRAQMGLVGALPGAIAGGLGTGAGVAIGVASTMLFRNRSRR